MGSRTRETGRRSEGDGGGMVAAGAGPTRSGPTGRGRSPMTRYIAAAIIGGIYVAAATWVVRGAGEAYRASLHMSRATAQRGAGASGEAGEQRKFIAHAGGTAPVPRPVPPEPPGTALPE